MPTISIFYGIKIYIYWKDNKKHNIPHFHAYYAGKNAVFNLEGDLIEGIMPKRALMLIKEWSLENKKEIRYAWECAFNLKTPKKIKGLK